MAKPGNARSNWNKPYVQKPGLSTVEIGSLGWPGWGGPAGGFGRGGNERQRLLGQGIDNPDRRFSYIQCLSNIFNTNGRPGQVTNADPRFVDYYGRPWAKNWELYFEKDWEKPEPELPSAITDIFK